MPRISISIPDALMEALDPIKGQINVSQVCREALERRVAIYQGATGQHGDDLDVEGLITRLREERALTETKWQDFGRQNAAEWLRTASYLEVKTVVENQSIPDMHRYRLPRAAFQIMKRHMEESKWSLEGITAVAYKTAWLDYARAVWAEIRDQVEQAKVEERLDTQPATTTE